MTFRFFETDLAFAGVLSAMGLSLAAGFFGFFLDGSSAGFFTFLGRFADAAEVRPAASSWFSLLEPDIGEECSRKGEGDRRVVLMERAVIACREGLVGLGGVS